MSKRKILTLAMALCMVAILAIGGTLAYFTDTDSATNVFTVGNVNITLKENFDKDNAKLLPGSKTENAIKKEVTIAVENGSETAYVWYEWLIPSVLDTTDGKTGTDNIVHVNAAGANWDKYNNSDDDTNTWDHDPEVELGYTQNGPEGFIGTEEIGGIKYNKYLVLYHGKVEAGKATTVGMTQVYLDSRVDTNAQGQYTFNGEVIDYDFTKGINIIVRAYGIQAAGFDNVYDAYKAYTAQVAAKN